jgi:hypothetical protein
MAWSQQALLLLPQKNGWKPNKKHFDKEISYVIYSHDRADSISGGEVFEDTAVIIAHKNKYEAIID